MSRRFGSTKATMGGTLDDALEHMENEGLIIWELDEEGVDRVYPTPKLMFCNAKEEKCPSPVFRAIVKELEKRGLMQRVRNSARKWIWNPTPLGHRQGLASSEIAVHTLLSTLGLSSLVEEAKVAMGERRKRKSM